MASPSWGTCASRREIRLTSTPIGPAPRVRQLAGPPLTWWPRSRTQQRAVSPASLSRALLPRASPGGPYHTPCPCGFRRGHRERLHPAASQWLPTVTMAYLWYENSASVMSHCHGLRFHVDVWAYNECWGALKGTYMGVLFDGIIPVRISRLSPFSRYVCVPSVEGNVTEPTCEI